MPLIMMVVGPVHIVLYFLSGLNLSKYSDEESVNILFSALVISFLIFYICVVDFGDAPGTASAFFHQVRDTEMLNMLSIISRYSAIINILLIIIGFTKKR